MRTYREDVSIHSVADLVATVRKKGVRLWCEGGRLHYEGPQRALGQDEIQRLRDVREEIVAYLMKTAGAGSAELGIHPRLRPDRAPLSFSQLAHWNFHQLAKRPSIRQIAIATRLRGQLNIDLLQMGLTEMVRRHEALRTRIVIADGVPVQEIFTSGECVLEVENLKSVPDDLREMEVQVAINKLLSMQIDLSVGPFFEAKLLSLRDDEHVLVLVLDHMVSDMFSMHILFRELSLAYQQLKDSRTVSLPRIPIQFADYAAWQRETEGAWFEKHREYYAQRLAGRPRLKFPKDALNGTPTSRGWGTVSFRIGKGLRAELSEWCKDRRTTLVMSVLSAYAGLVLRWCNTSNAIIQHQTNSRTIAEIEGAIGYFTSRLLLVVELKEGDSFIDLLSGLTEEYCRAYEHADLSYYSAQEPCPDFVRNPVFNWVPPGSAGGYFGAKEGGITASSVPFSHPAIATFDLDREPGILFNDSGDEVLGGLYFPLNRFSTNTMERFARNVLVFLESLVKNPNGLVHDVGLLS